MSHTILPHILECIIIFENTDMKLLRKILETHFQLAKYHFHEFCNYSHVVMYEFGILYSTCDYMIG